MNRFPKSAAQPTTFVKNLGVGLLLLSFLALLLAPMNMPNSYSWLQHTTSESAARGIAGAWLARLGFLIFGLTVFWLSERLRDSWPLPVRLMHGAFGLFMVGAAVFSSRPWLPNLPFDPVEDGLHSFMSTAMSFAFAIGVGLRLWHRGEKQQGRILDVLATVASVAIPLAMSALPEWDGLLQRGMFATAYIWYSFQLLSQSNSEAQ